MSQRGKNKVYIERKKANRKQIEREEKESQKKRRKVIEREEWTNKNMKVFFYNPQESFFLRKDFDRIWCCSEAVLRIENSCEASATVPSHHQYLSIIHLSLPKALRQRFYLSAHLSLPVANSFTIFLYQLTPVRFTHTYTHTSPFSFCYLHQLPPFKISCTLFLFLYPRFPFRFFSSPLGYSMLAFDISPLHFSRT